MVGAENRRARLQRPAYRDAVRWIAENDGSVTDAVECLELREGHDAGAAERIEALSGLLTVVLVADLFAAALERVARDVLRHSRRNEARLPGRRTRSEHASAT